MLNYPKVYYNGTVYYLPPQWCAAWSRAITRHQGFCGSANQTTRGRVLI